MKNSILFLILIATNLFGIVYKKKCFLNRNYDLVYLIVTDKQKKIIFPELGVKNGKLKFIEEIVGLRKEDNKFYYARIYDVNFTKSLKVEDTKILIDNKPYTIYSNQYGEIKSFDDFYKNSKPSLLNIKHKNYKPNIEKIINFELFLFVIFYIIGRFLMDIYLKDKIIQEIGVKNKRISDLTDLKSLYYFVVEKNDKQIYEFMNTHLTDKQFLTGENIDYPLMNGIFVYTKQKYIQIKTITMKEAMIIIIIAFLIDRILLCNF